MKTRRVYLSPLAERKLTLVLEYLETEWSEKIKYDYLQTLKQQLEKISQNPTAYPALRGFKEVRKCQVTKHNSLFFRYSESEVEVISHFDNRQNPKKIWEEIKPFL